MKIFKNTAFLLVGLLLFSCTEDKAILVDDTLLSYEIPKVPVNTDYTVGAIYKMEKITSTLETPSIGKYNINNGNTERALYDEHMKQAQTAGVDFFIFNFRSTFNDEQYKTDNGNIVKLQKDRTKNDTKFALSYNFGSMLLTNTNRIEPVGLVATFLKDFELMNDFFDEKNYPNYMRIDNKPVIYINNSHNLFANDNLELYRLLRNKMRELRPGLELYLIGMQNEWTPTLRFDFRFVGCVDALTVTNYALINKSFYDRFYFFHKFIDLAWSGYKDKDGVEYNHKATLAKYNIEFVPTISPSYNAIAAANYDIPKNADWFKANCNIARRASGANKLVIIDSFNDWNLDTQIESAKSYGEDYLKILRSEFKVN
jgi:hypothetical protein